MNNDFIGIYDNEEKPFSVTSVVTWFINNYNTTKSKESGLSYFNRHRKRICTSKTLDFGEDYEPNKVIYYLVNEAKNQYVKTYPFLNKLKWRIKINLNDGLSQTFDWYLNNKNFFNSVSKKLYINRLGLNK